MKKIIRVSTVPLSLDMFCRGLLRELSVQYEVVALSSPGKELAEIAAREQVRTVAVPMQRRISPLHDIISLMRLVAVFQKERPQMVHSITPKAGLLSMVAARIAGVPVRVHTFTGLVFPTASGWKRRMLMLTDKLTCLCATHVVPEGDGVMNDLRNHGITNKPMQVLGYGNVRGIDLSFYNKDRKTAEAAHDIRVLQDVPQQAFTFVYVGRLVRDKGIGELSEAFCRLLMSHPEVHLLLVGDEEPQLDPLDETTRSRLRSSGNIHRCGWQSDVRPWYAAADAFVFPSYREGFPNVVIEAGAMGLPCIVTDINGSREIIRDGVNGKIVPPHDSHSLYFAMKTCVECPDMVKEWASQSRPLIASRFEQGYVRRCLKDFYKKILE